MSMVHPGSDHLVAVKLFGTLACFCLQLPAPLDIAAPTACLPAVCWRQPGRGPRGAARGGGCRQGRGNPTKPVRVAAACAVLWQLVQGPPLQECGSLLQLFCINQTHRCVLPPLITRHAYPQVQHKHLLHGFPWSCLERNCWQPTAAGAGLVVCGPAGAIPGDQYTDRTLWMQQTVRMPEPCRSWSHACVCSLPFASPFPHPPGCACWCAGQHCGCDGW
jgi:hypothetical protein